MRQILLNLAGNAVKFTREGEVIVRADVDQASDTDVRVRFEIADTGIGMSEEQTERIFEPFVQADSSMTRRFGGTGLGLTISWRLAEAMGGEIGIVSAQGQGSTFWFTARLERSDEKSSRSLPADLLRDQRVLVVDDNATNRTILEEQLAGWGLRCVAVESGPEALSTLATAASQEQPYALVLLDMQMPDMDGMQVARTIRGDPTLGHTPLVLLTSLGRSELGADPDEAGIRAVLAKPVRQSRLLETIMEVLAPADVPNTPASLGRTTDAPAPTFAGGRILVAEDVAVNQALARGILTKLGFRADVVGDGREALEALDRLAYDAVLMDIQMPDMDGLEAAREIRRREKERGGHVPIIAMTANAMKGDRERCLAAGMDDYVAKPVRPNEVAAALQRWVHGPSAEDTVPVDAPAPVSGDGAESVLDRETIDNWRTDDPELLVELVQLFLHDTPQRLVELRSASDRDDADAVRRAAHALKSSAGTLGATELQEFLVEIEARAYTGTVAGDLVAAAQQAFDRVRPLLERERGAATDPP